MRYGPEWSPDSKKIAFSDKDGRLYVVTVADKKLVQVAQDRRQEIGDYHWSPGGAYLAFSMTDPNNFRSIWIWSAEDGKLRRVTGEDFNEREPVWDPKGKYLYYISGRDYAPQFDAIDFNLALDRNDRPLRPRPAQGRREPLPARGRQGDGRGGEEGREGRRKEGRDEKKDEKKEAPVKSLKIDFDGLASRVVRIPVPFDNYGGLYAADGRLIYVKFPANSFGEPASQPALQIFTFKDRKATTLTEGVNGYSLSANGEKVLVRQQRTVQRL